MRSSIAKHLAKTLKSQKFQGIHSHIENDALAEEIQNTNTHINHTLSSKLFTEAMF